MEREIKFIKMPILIKQAVGRMIINILYMLISANNFRNQEIAYAIQISYIKDIPGIRIEHDFTHIRHYFFTECFVLRAALGLPFRRGYHANILRLNCFCQCYKIKINVIVVWWIAYYYIKHISPKLPLY